MNTFITRAALLLCCAGWLAVGGPALAEDAKPDAKPLKLTTTADHTKFKQLQKTFDSALAPTPHGSRSDPGWC